MTPVEPSWDRRRGALLAVLVTLMAAYLPTLGLFPVSWVQNYQEHGFLVGAIVGWVIWRDRAAIVRAEGEHLPSLRWLVAALSLGWLAFAAMGVAAAEQVLLVCVLATWALATFGREARERIVAPALTLTLAIPMWEFMNPALQRATTLMSGAIARALGASAVIRGDTIAIASGTFLVESGCSGINFLMAGLTLGAVYVHLFPMPWRTKLAVVAVSGFAGIIGNWIRVAVLVLLGDAWGIDSPLVTDHLWQGWLIFSILMLPTYFAARALERRAGRPQVGVGNHGFASLDPTLPRRAATAGAFAVVGPVLYFGVGALPQQDVDRSTAVIGLAPSWHPVPRTVGTDSWLPAFAGADETLLWTLALPGTTVDVSRMVYVDQKAGEELIQWNNAIAPDSLLLASRLIGPLGPTRRYMRAAILQAGDRPRLAWYWYRVGDVDTPFASSAKLLELIAFFTRSSPAELVALSAPCEATSCEAAAANLLLALEGGPES